MREQEIQKKDKHKASWKKWYNLQWLLFNPFLFYYYFIRCIYSTFERRTLTVIVLTRQHTVESDSQICKVTGKCPF